MPTPRSVFDAALGLPALALLVAQDPGQPWTAATAALLVAFFALTGAAAAGRAAESAWDLMTIFAGLLVATLLWNGAIALGLACLPIVAVALLRAWAVELRRVGLVRESLIALPALAAAALGLHMGMGADLAAKLVLPAVVALALVGRDARARAARPAWPWMAHALTALFVGVHVGAHGWPVPAACVLVLALHGSARFLASGIAPARPVGPARAPAPLRAPPLRRARRA